MPALCAADVEAVGCRRTVSAIGYCECKRCLSYEMPQQNVSTYTGFARAAAGSTPRQILENRARELFDTQIAPAGSAFGDSRGHERTDSGLPGR